MSEARTLRVEGLAAEAGTSVDTIRYYQRLRLLDPPRRVGRHAEYTGAHLARLAEIRRLADRVTVLRDGTSVASKPTSALSTDDMIKLMVGRAVSVARLRLP